MSYQIQQKSRTDTPISLANILPQRLAGHSVAEVSRMRVNCGNRQVELGEIFDIRKIEEKPAGPQIVIEGDCSNVDDIGREMTTGHIEIAGNCGDRTGTSMSGGSIRLRGNAGHWLGAAMTGGAIQVDGHAGDYLAASLIGERVGMNRGRIVINGDAGDFAGRQMRRGFLFVRGSCGRAPGWNMRGGTFVIQAPPHCDLGTDMVRGSIVVLSEYSPGPSFLPGGRFQSPILNFIATAIEQADPPSAAIFKSARHEIWHGDRVRGARGELLVARPAGD